MAIPRKQARKPRPEPTEAERLECAEQALRISRENADFHSGRARRAEEDANRLDKVLRGIGLIVEGLGKSRAERFDDLPF